MTMTRLRSQLLLLLLLSHASAELKLPTFLSDHMVLQRAPQKSRLWGWADPGSNVTANLDGLGVIAFAIASTSDDGKWVMELPPQPTGVNHEIVLSEDDSDDSVITIKDIAYGDVFLCSGQSNMVMSVKRAFNGTAEATDSINYPHLRFASVKLTVADEPQEDVQSAAPFTWARSGPDAFAPDFGGWPSATCYYFGREIYKRHAGQLPIGLVISCWGGQKIEVFSSPDALSDDTCGGTRPPGTGPPYNPKSDTYAMNVAFVDEPSYFPPSVQEQPAGSQLWNAMIHPFLQMRFAGATWYQGEANKDDPESYSCRFPAMITDWRLKMELPDMPFYYVQLAAYPTGDFSLIRSAQGAALQLPKVGVASAIDIGDTTGPDGAIHPRRKQEVGRRLALNALAFQYGSDTAHEGPTVTAVQQTDTGALIGFEPTTARGLHFEGTATCDECCYQSPFEVLGESGNWTRASAAIQDDGITVRVTYSDQIFGIRFDWEGLPQCALYNGQNYGGPDDHVGISALPFEWCAYPTGKPSWSGQACGLSEGRGIGRPMSSLIKSTAQV